VTLLGTNHNLKATEIDLVIFPEMGERKAYACSGPEVAPIQAGNGFSDMRGVRGMLPTSAIQDSPSSFLNRIDLKLTICREVSITLRVLVKGCPAASTPAKNKFSSSFIIVSPKKLL
jgi:hypothetical protein